MLCIGGATVDRRYRLAEPLRPATSNPAAGLRGYGGVARNVAEALARFGQDVGLLSCVGDDEEGRALVKALEALAIDTRGVVTVAGAATAEYAAVLTPAGDLAFGIADMAILDGLTPAMLERHATLLATADWIFADCNLPRDSLAVLAERSTPNTRYRLAVDPVSVAKASRLPQRLEGIDLLILNRDEARFLLGRAAAAAVEAEALRLAGAGRVVLTLGSDGAVVAGPDGTSMIDAVPAEVVDVTGAGDSLIAGTLFGLIGGADFVDAVRLGCRAAAHTVRCTETVSPDLRQALDGFAIDFTKVF